MRLKPIPLRDPEIVEAEAWRDTALSNVRKPPWWSWSVAITASRSKPPTGNAVTPTTGFISIRLGPVAGPTTTTPTNDPLLGWSVVVSEVSGFASLSTRVYAHAPFVNDECFGVVDADGRSLTSLTRLTNAPLTAQPKTSARGKKGGACLPPRPESRDRSAGNERI